jgi:hypothetical protein
VARLSAFVSNWLASRHEIQQRGAPVAGGTLRTRLLRIPQCPHHFGISGLPVQEKLERTAMAAVQKTEQSIQQTVSRVAQTVLPPFDSSNVAM